LPDTSLVSIIITAHNYARWLPEALNSALTQTWPSTEVVVVDDGSSDETPKIVSDYEDRFKVRAVRLEGEGLAAACNAGIRTSTGDYIVRLDADDYFDPNLALVLATHLDQHDDDIVFGDHWMIDENGVELRVVHRAPLGNKTQLRDRPALGAGVMFRRKVFDEIGGYDNTLRHQEDYDFWLQVVEKYRIANVSLPLMYYRQHGASMSTNWSARIAARQGVKRKHREARGLPASNASAVILVDRFRLNDRAGALASFGDTTLLDHAVTTLRNSDSISSIHVAGGDAKVAARADVLGLPHIDAAIQDVAALSHGQLYELAQSCRQARDTKSTVWVTLSPRTPFITAAQIDEALDTMELYDTGSVVALSPEHRPVWVPAEEGVRPVSPVPGNVSPQSQEQYAAVSGFAVFDLEPSHRTHASAVGNIEVESATTSVLRSTDELSLAEHRLADTNRSDNSRKMNMTEDPL
jgi:hypothetical protein